MRQQLIALGILLAASPVYAQHADHPEVVREVKAALVSFGTNLEGPCGAFEITQRVAFRLAAEGAGVLSKPAGNNCRGYSVDIIAYPDGNIVDILVAAGDADGNGPSWNTGAPVDPSRWRPSPFTGDVVPTPVPVPAPAPLPSTDLSPVLNALEVMRMQQQADTAAILARIDLFEQHAKGAFYNFVKTYGPMLLGALGLLGGLTK